VVLANGETKNIEDILPGDKVKTVDHQNPDGEIVTGQVVRVFQNDPQPLWRLNFGTFEIHATKEHPFYVKGKGWVPAGDLQIGDVCRSASDMEIILVAKEFEPEFVPVYNFEVENLHSYFVGNNIAKSVLVHNSCWDYLDPALGGVEGVFTFVAGGIDNLTFGATSGLRSLYSDNQINYKTVYVAGEITETVAELAFTGGSAALKKAATKVIEKKASEIIAKQGIKVITKEVQEAAESKARKQLGAELRREARNIMKADGIIIKSGEQVHHIQSLLGHPGGASTPFQTLGVPWLANSKFNLQVLDHASHVKAHRLTHMEEQYLIKVINLNTTSTRVGVTSIRTAFDYDDDTDMPNQ
jgi:hypothetical protein